LILLEILAVEVQEMVNIINAKTARIGLNGVLLVVALAIVLAITLPTTNVTAQNTSFDKVTPDCPIPCRGDFDGDLDVDGSDLAVFARQFGHTACSLAAPCNGDFDCDGDMDGSDLAVFAADFGRTECPSVIEPLFGLNFSPYLDGQDPNMYPVVTEYQIQCRMQTIQPYTQWIRTFGFSDGLEAAAEIAQSLGLQIAAGAWIGRDLEANEIQLQNLIRAARSGWVDIAVIGSEVLLRGDVSEEKLIAYIATFKDQVPDVPVTTAEVYGILISRPALRDACDVIFANFYPYWEGVAVEQAIAHLSAQYTFLETAAGDKPVVVAETGWPTDGNSVGAAHPSPENARYYLTNFFVWAQTNAVDYFYFEAFDEKWKAKYEGPQGAHWGIWGSDGRLKPCMLPVFDPH
jgi:exo-beta-1,3-glucanase (GH17 family)